MQLVAFNAETERIAIAFIKDQGIRDSLLKPNLTRVHNAKFSTTPIRALPKTIFLFVDLLAPEG